MFIPSSGYLSFYKSYGSCPRVIGYYCHIILYPLTSCSSCPIIMCNTWLDFDNPDKNYKFLSNSGPATYPTANNLSIPSVSLSWNLGQDTSNRRPSKKGKQNRIICGGRVKDTIRYDSRSNTASKSIIFLLNL